MFEKISDLRDDGASGSAEDAVRTKVNWNGKKLEVNKTQLLAYKEAKNSLIQELIESLHKRIDPYGWN